jgi:hypothetical protein
MNPIISWPLTPQTFGGAGVLSQRALASQPHNLKGEFIQVQASGGAALKVRFVRQGVGVLLEFRGSDDDHLKLCTGSAVTTEQGRKYFAIRVDLDAGSLRVGLAFDQQRGHSMRCGPTGKVGGLVLPFEENEMVRVPKAALTSYSLNARILSSWSLLTMVALCRCSDAALSQVLAHQETLKQESLGMLDDLGRSYRLRTGRGITGIFLPTCRLDRVNA